MKRRSFGKILDEGLERRDEAEVVEHGGAQFAREPVHGVDRIFHEPLRLADLLHQVLDVDPRLHLEGGEMNVDADQRLDDFVMQLPADALALLLLGEEKLAGEMAQLLLHVQRLLEELNIVRLAFFQGLLGLVAARRFPLLTSCWKGQAVAAAWSRRGECEGRAFSWRTGQPNAGGDSAGEAATFWRILSG